MSGLRLKLEGIGWLIGWRLARMLPERIVYAAFDRMAERAYRKNERRRSVVRANLEPIVPADELDATVRESFRWYGRYWAETFRMEDVSSEELNRRFRVDGFEHIEKARDAGSGGVLATLHVGNWDAGGRWVAEQMPLTVVVEVLKPRVLFDRFVAHRRSLGMTIVPLERGGDATQRCLESLARGDMVALLADRDLGRSAIEVTMFGRTTRLPPGPAVLALRSGAPLLPAAIYQRRDGSWDTIVMPAIEKPDPEAPDAVAVLTQRLADAYATLIAHDPAQWHMLHPFWTDR